MRAKACPPLPRPGWKRPHNKLLISNIDEFPTPGPNHFLIIILSIWSRDLPREPEYADVATSYKQQLAILRKELNGMATTKQS